MSNFFITIADWNIPEILLVLSVALVIIDYFFPIDFPAFLGYFCFALGIFFLLPLSIFLSLLVAIAVFVALLLLHQNWWGKYLENAHTVPPSKPNE
jgi:membrane protein implicated in regulation of membrane protease activity